MTNLKLKVDPRVQLVTNKYPIEVQQNLLKLRKLIIDTANNIEGITHLEETLKWNEPSYLTKNGSTIRIDWKSKSPNQIAMYFSCSTKLIPTFKILYQNMFRFEGSRAIIFKINECIPEEELKACITAALTYHKVKHLPALGM